MILSAKKFDVYKRQQCSYIASEAGFLDVAKKEKVPSQNFSQLYYGQLVINKNLQNGTGFVRLEHNDPEDDKNGVGEIVIGYSKYLPLFVADPAIVPWQLIGLGEKSLELGVKSDNFIRQVGKTASRIWDPSRAERSAGELSIRSNVLIEMAALTLNYNNRGQKTA